VGRRAGVRAVRVAASFAAPAHVFEALSLAPSWPRQLSVHGFLVPSLCIPFCHGAAAVRARTPLGRKWASMAEAGAAADVAPAPSEPEQATGPDSTVATTHLLCCTCKLPQHDKEDYLILCRQRGKSNEPVIRCHCAAAHVKGSASLRQNIQPSCQL
jgi:hypothetical protein